jgi:hypothetical protein
MNMSCKGSFTKSQRTPPAKMLKCMVFHFSLNWKLSNSVAIYTFLCTSLELIPLAWNYGSIRFTCGGATTYCVLRFLSYCWALPDFQYIWQLTNPLLTYELRIKGFLHCLTLSKWTHLNYKINVIHGSKGNVPIYPDDAHMMNHARDRIWFC